jgi:CHAT domain-containing protein
MICRICFLLFIVGSLRVTAQSYAEMEHKVAQLYQEGKFGEAIPIAINAKDAAERESGSSSADFGTSLNDLGLLYIEIADYEHAEPLLKQASAILRNSLGAKHPRYATALNNLAELYKSIGNYTAAEPLYKEASAIYKKVSGENHPSYAISLSNLGGLYVSMGNYAAAEPLFNKASAIYKSALGEENPSYANSLNNLGQLYTTLGNYATAERLLKQACDIYQKVLGEGDLNYAKSLNSLAILYVRMSKYALAERLYNQIIAIVKKILGDEHPDYATCLDNLAEVYFDMGNYAAAERLYQQAFVIRKKVLGEEHPDYAMSLNNLAGLYGRMGNYLAAEPLYKQALAIYKKALGEQHPQYANSLDDLASLYLKMGNYDAAESFFKQASAIRKKILGEEHPDYATSLADLAGVYVKIGNYSAAESLYKQASDIYKKVLGEEHPYYATSLNELAALYYIQRNDNAAEPLYKQASAIRKKTLGEEHPDYAQSLNNLAQLYLSMGNDTAAEPLFKQASAIWKKVFGEEHPEYAQSLNSLAAVYERRGNYDLAATYFISGGNLGFRHFERNMDDLSEVEKLKWWETEKGNFNGLTSLLVTNPHTSVDVRRQVCNVQLQLKGFILNDIAKVLKEARNGDPQLQKLLAQWQSNKIILANQYSLPVANRIPMLDSLEKQTNDQEKQINLQSSAFHITRQNKQIGFVEVQQQLKPGEAAVEFIRFQYYHKDLTDSILYAAFLILPGNTVPGFVTLCEEKELAALLENKSNSSEQFVKELYRGVDVTNTQAEGKKGNRLYNLIWKPLLPWLKGIKRISIAPAGLLNRLAFNALPVDSSTLLIDKYQLRQYSSVRQIAEQKIPAATKSTAIDAILYGGIDFNVSDATAISDKETSPTVLPDDVKRSIQRGVWNSLPGTVLEVNNIRQLFDSNKKKFRVITGEDATEESFKQLSGHSPRIIHLATHGFSLPDSEAKGKNLQSSDDNQFTMADNPLLRSGIIMAGANRVWNGSPPLPGKEDGILTAYEISNLDLSNTELVVLSACETALGDIKGTEGVFGLQRAFKLAGVQNMILSLWPIPDKETAVLMDLFYTNKLKGMSNYDAFYKAQHIMRKNYPPYYWAAFVLVE